MRAHSILAEWWTDRIQPWVHYVPIQMDYSDLYDALSFVSASSTASPLSFLRLIVEAGIR